MYPGEFLVPRSVTDEDGVVHEYTEPIAGEAWDGGPVLLSWEDTQAAGIDEGAAYSVVIHEFTHKIDLLNGDADGVPPFSPALHAGLELRQWQAALADAFQRFVTELELIEGELPPDVDPDSNAADPFYAHLPLDAYAAQDAGEFFAVSSESFLRRPGAIAAGISGLVCAARDFLSTRPAGRQMKSLLIVYHSMTGAAEQLANAADEGARSRS